MSVAVPDTDIDRATVEDVEDALVLPCEHSQHHTRHHLDMPASWRVFYICKNWACTERREYLLCEEGKQIMAPPRTIGCRRCGAAGTWDEFFIFCEPLEGK